MSTFKFGTGGIVKFKSGTRMKLPRFNFWWERYANPNQVSIPWPTHAGYAETTAGMGSIATPTTIRFVTNLSSSGVGSFDQAITDHNGDTGPSVILFNVAGIADLPAQLEITRGDLTILGDSAPPPGFMLKGDGIAFDNNVTDILVRHLTVMTGRFDVEGGQSPDTRDALQIRTDTYNLVFMNNTVAFGTDGNWDWTHTPNRGRNNTDVWFNMTAWCLGNAGHSEGNHSRSIMLGRNHGRVSMIGHYDVMSRERHPICAGTSSGSAYATASIYIANHVVYGWSNAAVDIPQVVTDGGPWAETRTVWWVVGMPRPKKVSTENNSRIAFGHVGDGAPESGCAAWWEDSDWHDTVINNFNTWGNVSASLWDFTGRTRSGGTRPDPPWIFDSASRQFPNPVPARFTILSSSDVVDFLVDTNGAFPKQRNILSAEAWRYYTSSTAPVSASPDIDDPRELMLDGSPTSESVVDIYGYPTGSVLAEIVHASHSDYPSNPTDINADGWPEVYRYVMRNHTINAENVSRWLDVVEHF